MMDNIQWYAIAFAVIATLVFCHYATIKIVDLIDSYVAFHFRKYIFYHRVPKLLWLSSTANWFHVLLILIYLVGNALCLSIRFTSREQLMQQAGLLSTVNLIPLALGGHMNIFANRISLQTDTYNRIHRWVARVVVIEGLLHGVLALTSQAPKIQSSSQIAAVVVSAFNICSMNRSSDITCRPAPQ
jgi:hypothetical protein